MGSGSSKVVIKRENPEVQVNYNAVNGEVDQHASAQRGEAVKADKPVESEKQEPKQTDVRKTTIHSPPADDNEPEQVKPVSKTLQKTKDKLKVLGSLYEDPILASYCDETPALLTDFTRLHKYLDQIKQNLGKEDFVTHISRPISQISSLYNKERPDKIKKGSFLADVGFGEICKEILVKLFAKHSTLLSYDRELDETENEDDKKSIEPLQKAQDCLANLTSLCINYTDLCDAINLAFSKAGLIPIFIDMVEKTKDCTEHHIQYMDSSGKLSKKTVRGNFLSRSLGTLHNLSKRVPTRANFHACNAVRVVLPLLDNKVTFFATKALLLLAYLIDESNNELIMANEGPIKFLITLIDKATSSSNKRYLGFSSAELAEGLAQIAINDANKKTIVANGALAILTRMIKEYNREEEEIEGVGALWVLAFDEDNREKMRKTPGLVELLKSLQGSSNDEVQKAASGALWEIEGKQNLITKSSADLNNSSSTKNHVMISYQWDVQKILVQVKNRLQAAGFRVWMDLDQMGGSTLEAMARAVEDSAVVLVCVSQKYKESSNCRSEAEYAFQLKKDIVPLMMENNYRPDGWLGMIMGSKLWIDFSQGQRKLDNSLRDLVKELGSRGKGGEELVEAALNDTVDAAPPPSFSPKLDISAWTNKDVVNWIRGFGVELKKKNSLNKLNGSLLTRLHALRIESPEFYYTALKDDIGLYNVYSVLLFTDELEKLVG